MLSGLSIFLHALLEIGDLQGLSYEFIRIASNKGIPAGRKVFQVTKEATSKHQFGDPELIHGHNLQKVLSNLECRLSGLELKQCCLLPRATCPTSGDLRANPGGSGFSECLPAKPDNLGLTDTGEARGKVLCSHP